MAASRSCGSTGAICCRGVGGLTREQKREFGVGWLNWLGAEAIGVVVAILNLVWVPVVAFAGIAIPDMILTLPILAAFVVTFAHFIALYRLRVAISFGQMMAAVVAAMSVQWTVARAVGYGIWKESLPFMRTAKGGATSKGPDFPAFWEAVLAALLLIGAVIVVATNYKQIREINIFAAGARGPEPAVPRGRGNWRPWKPRASTTSPTGTVSRRGSPCPDVPWSPRPRLIRNRWSAISDAIRRLLIDD